MVRFISLLLCAAAVVAALVAAARAVTIETVRVGNAGNPGEQSRLTLYGDPTYYGGVDYVYNIGTYQVTAGQYCEFLRAVAGVDAYGLYDTEMWSTGWGCKIERYAGTGTSDDPYQYRIATDWANRPVNHISWGDAARFANWLHNGQPAGAQDATTTEDGAYDLSATHPYYGPDGALPSPTSPEFAALNSALLAVTRKSGWQWAVPTENEWYKAAYHKNDGPTANYFTYATATDTMPSNDLVDPDPGNNATYGIVSQIGEKEFTIGGPYFRTEVGAHENSESPYGTFDQSANVSEWNETLTFSGSYRGMRGASAWLGAGGAFGSAEGRDWLMSALRREADVTYGRYDYGLRVVTVPEPSVATLLLLAVVGLLARRNRVCERAV